MVEAVGDPLVLASLLAEGPIAVGDHWRVGRDAATEIERLRRAGGQRGSRPRSRPSTTPQRPSASRGGPGARPRRRGDHQVRQARSPSTLPARRLARLVLNRHESRKPGPGRGRPGDQEHADRRATADRPRRACRPGPGGGARRPRPRPPAHRLDPDRSRWQVHVAARPRLAHLLGRQPPDGSEAARPRRGRGAVQPQPRAEGRARQAPGPGPVPRRRAPRSVRRFVQFVGVGEVDGDPAGFFRYKVAVQGKQGEVGILWDYYLLAGPEGDQLLVTFTHSRHCGGPRPSATRTSRPRSARSAGRPGPTRRSVPTPAHPVAGGSTIPGRG